MRIFGESRLLALDLPEFKVLRLVVVTAAVLVVNTFPGLKWSPELLLHDVTVFQLPPINRHNLHVALVGVIRASPYRGLATSVRAELPILRLRPGDVAAAALTCSTLRFTSAQDSCACPGTSACVVPIIVGLAAYRTDLIRPPDGVRKAFLRAEPLVSADWSESRPTLVAGLGKHVRPAPPDARALPGAPSTRRVGVSVKACTADLACRLPTASARLTVLLSIRTREKRVAAGNT